MEDLVPGVLSGQRRAIARAISCVEAGQAAAAELLERLAGRIGRAHRIGITGPPGVGKSTLTAVLARELRQRGRRVAVIAIDPSSPFTGGAILGDRVRMAELDADDDVFIRSMASRGAVGGLSAATSAATDILDAAGFDDIIIETVGVGQSEIEIAHATATTVVVLNPESGDDIQAAKAGLMEIADLFVLNKCDRPGSHCAGSAIRAMLDLRRHRKPDAWAPPLLRTEAVNGRGIAQLADAIELHRNHLVQ